MTKQGNKTHSWKAMESTVGGIFWSCDACGIGDFDQMANKKCPNYNPIRSFLKGVKINIVRRFTLKACK